MTWTGNYCGRGFDPRHLHHFLEKIVKNKVKELTLEELEIVKGGFDYSGFYRYRADILNTFQIKRQSSRKQTIYMYESVIRKL